MRAPARYAVTRCPRCGYLGQSTSYFSRPSHVGLLVGVSLFTYGLGGLAYWFARRYHGICPSCGLVWGTRAATEREGRPPGADPDTHAGPPSQVLPSQGLKRRVVGAGGLLLGAFLVMISIVEAEPAAAAVGLTFAATGSTLFFWGRRALMERRDAILIGLQSRVLELASARGGTLTVTEVAAALELTMSAADRVLTSMDDGFRVRSDVTDEGLIVYEFPEVRHRGSLSGGSGAAG